MNAVQTEAGKFIEHTYQLTNNTELRLSTVFRTLHELFVSNRITDFEVTRTTLEQVFIYFAKFQIRGGVMPPVPQM